MNSKYKNIQTMQESQQTLQRVRGCLFGGAVGDALGYPIEFLEENEIFARYGAGGLQQYRLDKASKKALISDDTQMTLFTANGILFAETRGSMRGIAGTPSSYVVLSYQDWLRTQELSYKESRMMQKNENRRGISWLLDVPELYNRRAPGNTCLSELSAQKAGGFSSDFTGNAHNDSKGCGGIMRVAPIALKRYPYMEIKEIDREGAEIAAITHGHSLGYMPAAVLTHIISRIVYPKKLHALNEIEMKESKRKEVILNDMALKDIIIEARETITEIFAYDKHLKELTDIIDLAVSLSENTQTDLENIHQIGEGWVAEETLGIALYCALRYQDDFTSGVIAAVNHNGDSDSTGAITGNILGALLGYQAIEEKWKKDLELADVILEIADDLCHGCQINEYCYDKDPDWTRKYIECHWKEEKNMEFHKTKLEAVKGDITKNQGVEAIVNAANTSLLSGGGVDGAIHRAAGPELLAECRLLNGCQTGKAKITKAYRLPCTYVIHTPGPRWLGGMSNERELLASCYQSCLELSAENGIRTIAFPSISTGIYHFPLDEAAKIAVQTVRDYITSHPETFDLIKWVLFDNMTLETYQRELEAK